MKKRRCVFLPVIIAAVVCVCAACAGQDSGTAAPSGHPRMPASLHDKTAGEVDAEKIADTLEQIAELERSGIFLQGMGFSESALRDSIGDYAGAAVAVYKELSWAYGHGFMEKKDLKESLERLHENAGKQGKESAVQAARAIINFEQKQWDETEKQLTEIFGEIDEPDNYVNMMLLACALEKNPGNKKAASTYRSIRARYSQFPEFWHRGAKLFSGYIAAEYAELCLNLSSDGPYTAECRSILSVNLGLKAEDGASIKSKKEIDDLVSGAVSQGDPQVLESLLPLISLPENPLTVYATGALKPLAAVPKFREFFNARAANSKGRLAERLNYICWG